MNVLGLIVARAGSERLPNKHVLPLCGKPLIAYTITAALQAERLDRVVVSTDGEDIAEVACSWGAEVIWRPEELAASTAPIDPTLHHTIEYLKDTEGYKTDVIVLMVGNLPIRAKGTINSTIKKLLSCSASAAATAFEVDQHPEWMKHLEDGRAKDYIAPNADQGQWNHEKLYMYDGAAIAVKADTLRRTRGDSRAFVYLGQDVRMIIHSKIYSIQVHTQEDLWLVECLLKGGVRHVEP